MNLENVQSIVPACSLLNASLLLHCTSVSSYIFFLSNDEQSRLRRLKFHPIMHESIFPLIESACVAWKLSLPVKSIIHWHLFWMKQHLSPPPLFPAGWQTPAGGGGVPNRFFRRDMIEDEYEHFVKPFVFVRRVMIQWKGSVRPVSLKAPDAAKHLQTTWRWTNPSGETQDLLFLNSSASRWETFGTKKKAGRWG